MHFPQVVADRGTSFAASHNPSHRPTDGSFEFADPVEFDKPTDSPTFNEVWVEMEKVLASGKVKAIGQCELDWISLVIYVCYISCRQGVSNFSIKT
jgi:hypothetical protein